MYHFIIPSTETALILNETIEKSPVLGIMEYWKPVLSIAAGLDLYTPERKQVTSPP